jgi:putative transposase
VTVYRWIEAEKARRPCMKVSTACRVLGVSRSGFYDWRKRGEQLSRREVANGVLLEAINHVHRQFPAYGSPRVHQELRRREHSAGRHRVARLMRHNGMRARRGKVKSRPRAAPPRRRVEVVDLVKRNFTAEAPNRLWCVDVTQIRTREGWLYAAVLIDAYSRRVVGWSATDRDANDLPLKALQVATTSRRPGNGLIVHSDRGYQFTSGEWLDTLRRAGYQPSIGRVGTALDNALIESWFSSFKCEAIHPFGVPATRAMAQAALVRHIDFHNRERLHSYLGYTTPTGYETIQHKVSV